MTMTKRLRLTVLILCCTLILGGRPMHASLGGRPLYCCTLINNPITYEDPLKKPYYLSGIGISYLFNLMREANFTCTDVEQVKVSDKGGFTNFVNAMEQCHQNPNRSAEFFDNLGLSRNMCKCDLGTGGWSYTSRRLGKIDYLPYFTTGNLRVITNVQNTASTFSGPFFVTAFTSSVWIAIAGLVVVWTFLKMLDRRFLPPADDFTPLSRDHSQFSRSRHILLKSNVLRRLRLSFMATISRMVGEGDEIVRTRVSSTRHWVLNTSIMLCGLFLVLAYEATMTANLVQEERTSEFRSIEDFRSCKIRPRDVCIMSGTSQEAFWRTSIANKDCNESLHTTTNEDDLNLKVYNGTCKYGVVYLTTALAATTGRYCRKLVIVGKPFNDGGVSYILPKGRDYLTELTNATLRLRENGELQTPEDYFGDSGCEESSEATRLSFKRLELFFIVAYGACAVFFVYMLIDPQKPLKNSTSTSHDEHEENDEEVPKMEHKIYDERTEDNSSA